MGTPGLKNTTLDSYLKVISIMSLGPT